MSVYQDTCWNPATEAAKLNASYTWPAQHSAGLIPTAPFVPNTAKVTPDEPVVRIGGLAPMFPQIEVANESIVRLGGLSPLF